MGLLKATLNGKELPIKITKVNRNVMPNMKNKTVQISGRNGEVYQQTSYGAKTISIEYQINNRLAKDLTKFRRDLSGLLYYSEPKRLIFSDEPNLYYDAIVTGEQTLDENDENSNGTIIFSVPAGCAFSIGEKSASNNGNGTITVINEGTESVPISVEATMKSDNGYFALVLDDKYWQIGNSEEVDGTTTEMSVKLFDDHLNINRGWSVNNGITPPVTSEQLQNGSIGYKEETENEGYVYVSDYASGTSWHGAAITKNVPADENGELPTNWRATWRFDFNMVGGYNNDPEGGVGHQSITFSDEEDNIIASVVFEDNQPTRVVSDMAVYIGDKREWDNKNTNLFYVTGRGDDGPCAVVEKIGDQINVRFSYADINKSFTTQTPEAKLKKITWYAAAYKDYKNMRNNFLRAINVVKHNVQHFDDIPNYFSSGDKVELEGETGKVFINGTYNTDVVDMGSKTLMLPPGQHTIGIAKSTFADIPDVTLYFRERWI